MSSRIGWLMLSLVVACTKKTEHPLAPQPEVTLPGGVVVQVLREGDGTPTKKGDKITIHFVGRLGDGGVFDSSRQRNQPFSFWVGEGQVVQGLDEGLLGVKEGELRTVRIPAARGYGSEEKPGIPPNSTLEFEVELVNIR